MTPLGEGSARLRDLTTHKIHKRQTAMAPVGFELAIPAIERRQTYVLALTTTGIGETDSRLKKKLHLI
jgi:hypothetical protein